MDGTPGLPADVTAESARPNAPPMIAVAFAATRAGQEIQPCIETASRVERSADPG
jgi:hypothetical protein